MDLNASARQQARQRWMEKDANYRSASLKFWNRETTGQRGLNTATIGFSRAMSNDLQRALYVQGQARQQYETLFSKYYAQGGDMIGKQEGRSRTAGRKGLLALTRARGALNNAVRNEYGPNMARRYQARLRQYQGARAKAINAIGVRPEYGAPVLMPPSNRLGGALQIASQIASLYTTISGFSGLGGGLNTPDFTPKPIPTLPNGMTDWSQAIVIGP